jgi:hypothetical protein
MRNPTLLLAILPGFYQGVSQVVRCGVGWNLPAAVRFFLGAPFPRAFALDNIISHTVSDLTR